MSSGDLQSTAGILCLVILSGSAFAAVLLIVSLGLVIRWRVLEFNRLWIGRAFLAVEAFLWMLVLLLRVEYLWKEWIGASPSLFKQLCRVYSLLSMGVFEIGFYSVLFCFLLQGSNMREREDSSQLNRRIIRKTIPLRILCLVLHGAVYILNFLMPQESSHPFYYSMYDDKKDMCIVPVATGSASLLVILVYLFFLNRLFRSVSDVSINIFTKLRLLRVRWLLNLLITASLLARCLMVYLTMVDAALAPYLLDAHNICVVLVVISSSWVFILRPVWRSTSEPLLYRISLTSDAIYDSHENGSPILLKEIHDPE